MSVLGVNKLRFKSKRKGAIFSVDTAALLIITTFIFMTSFYFGSETITAWECDIIRHDAMAVDHALRAYGESHKSIYSIRAEQSHPDDTYGDIGGMQAQYEGGQILQFKEQPSYPKTLAEIGEVQTNYGYISSLISFIGLSGNSPGSTYGNLSFERPIILSDYNYTPIPSGDGTVDDDGILHYSSYVLTVDLPNGTTYTSPGSNDTLHEDWVWSDNKK